MDDLLIIGSTCVDVIIPIDRLPKTGEDIQSFSQTFSIGGCGWNVYRAARLSGAAPVFLSPVGTGAYGDLVAREFAAWGLPVPKRADRDNGCCYCLVESGGERTFLSVRARNTGSPGKCSTLCPGGSPWRMCAAWNCRSLPGRTC